MGLKRKFIEIKLNDHCQTIKWNFEFWKIAWEIKSRSEYFKWKNDGLRIGYWGDGRIDK